MQTATEDTFNLSLLLEKDVTEVRLLLNGQGYTMAKPTGAFPINDGMLRINTEDGVAHTHRPWYNCIRIIYANSTHRDFEVLTPQLSIDPELRASLLPEGIRRIICSMIGQMLVCEGPIWFQYGEQIGFTDDEDFFIAINNPNGYAWTNDQSVVLWWRDEPVNSIFF